MYAKVKSLVNKPLSQGFKFHRLAQGTNILPNVYDPNEIGEIGFMLLDEAELLDGDEVVVLVNHTIQYIEEKIREAKLKNTIETTEELKKEKTTEEPKKEKAKKTKSEKTVSAKDKKEVTK